MLDQKLVYFDIYLDIETGSESDPVCVKAW